MKLLLLLFLAFTSSASNAYDAQNVVSTLQQVGQSRLGKIAGLVLVGLSNQMHPHKKDDCTPLFKVSAGYNRGVASVCNSAIGKYTVHMGFFQCFRVEVFSSNRQVVGELAGEYIFASNAESLFHKLKSTGAKDIGIIAEPNNCSWRITLENSRFIPVMHEIYGEIFKM